MLRMNRCRWSEAIRVRLFISAAPETGDENRVPRAAQVDGSDAFMRLQNLSQVDSHNRIVQKIDEALRRIADGTYGICEVCGQLIRKPRLVNLPFVHTCMECQTAMESPYGRR
jgi:DnaK suppressor protein